MAKEITDSVKENNLKANMKDSELDDESMESPFWFWVWMGGLLLLFIAFGVFNQLNTKSDTTETTDSPAATASADQAVTDQPSVTK